MPRKGHISHSYGLSLLALRRAFKEDTYVYNKSF